MFGDMGGCDRIQGRRLPLWRIILVDQKRSHTLREIVMTAALNREYQFLLKRLFQRFPETLFQKLKGDRS
jgi:hypothetical protein